MPNGKTLTIEAENNGPENVYIQSVTLNGQPHARTFLTHEALSQGGTLTFVMGPTPNKQWGSAPAILRSEEHTSELQSLMRISYAVFCLKKKKTKKNTKTPSTTKLQ